MLTRDAEAVHSTPPKLARQRTSADLSERARDASPVERVPAADVSESLVTCASQSGEVNEWMWREQRDGQGEWVHLSRSRKSTRRSKLRADERGSGDDDDAHDDNATPTRRRSRGSRRHTSDALAEAPAAVAPSLYGRRADFEWIDSADGDGTGFWRRKSSSTRTALTDAEANNWLWVRSMTSLLTSGASRSETDDDEGAWMLRVDGDRRVDKWREPRPLNATGQWLWVASERIVSTAGSDDGERTEGDRYDGGEWLWCDAVPSGDEPDTSRRHSHRRRRRRKKGKK